MRRLAGALLLCAGLAGAAEVADTVRQATADFLAGRLEDSAKSFRYLSLLGVRSPQPDANLAVLTRDSGDAQSAAALWVKASLLEDADGFIWNQRGWSALALDRPKEARESFFKAIERSTSSASQAEANLGHGWAALLDSRPKAAVGPLREALVQSPYIIPAAAHATGLATLGSGERQAALTYLRQAINLDPLHFEAIRQLARTSQKIGENKAAWRGYHRILSLDPRDDEAGKELAKLSKFMGVSPESLQIVRRLSRPMLNAEGKGMGPPAKSTETLRVALFSDAAGRPASAVRIYFMTNAPFRIVSAAGEVVKEDGKPFDQWEIVYRGDSGIVEVRDVVHNIQYTSKQRFRIVPDSRHGSVLLKSGEFVELSGFDAGDRELRGLLEVVPLPSGFRLVNEVFLEDYLYGVVTATLPEGSPREAYKAQSVFARTRALHYKQHREESPERSDICDSQACQRYLGLNTEMNAATGAVAETEGWVLRLNGALPRLAQHQSCGGTTEPGDKGMEHLASVDDGPTPSARAATPAELERWTHQFPPRDRYCEAGALSASADSRWVRVIEAEDIRRRAERTKVIGFLRHMRVGRRSATGRVETLEIQGSRDALTLEGEAAIAGVLSPGSLRSTLFTLQPISRGGPPTHFVVWGAGTGHGMGLCLAGTVGQASLGRSWKDILSHYFPRLKLESLTARPASASKAPAGGKKRPKNPRLKKSS